MRVFCGPTQAKPPLSRRGSNRRTFAESVVFYPIRRLQSVYLRAAIGVEAQHRASTGRIIVHPLPSAATTAHSNEPSRAKVEIADAELGMLRAAFVNGEIMAEAKWLGSPNRPRTLHCIDGCACSLATCLYARRGLPVAHMRPPRRRPSWRALAATARYAVSDDTSFGYRPLGRLVLRVICLKRSSLMFSAILLSLGVSPAYLTIRPANSDTSSAALSRLIMGR